MSYPVFLPLFIVANILPSSTVHLNISEVRVFSSRLVPSVFLRIRVSRTSKLSASIPLEVRVPIVSV